MTSPQRIVLSLFLVSIIAGLVTGSSFYYRLSYFWALLIAGSWAYSRYALRGVVVRRISRTTRSQVGQIYEERFEVVNNTRFPRLWIEVQDESTLPGSRGSQVLSMIGGGETRSYLVRTRLLERGVFPLGPTVVSAGDPFGLFPVSYTLNEVESLLVYPMIVDVSNFPNPSGWLSGGEALRRRTNQVTTNAAGVREYSPGDAMNRIHWLSTARRNRLMTKEFELDPLAEVWFFVDAAGYTHSSLPYQEPSISIRDMWRPNVKIQMPPSSEEYMVSIAASLSRYYIQRGRSVGLVTAGHTYDLLPSDRGGRQLGKILEVLALLRAEGRLPLQALVEAQAQNLPRGSTVVLITPSVGDSIALTVEQLIRRDMRPVVVLLDAASFGGPSGTEKVGATLSALNVPARKVACGDDLSAILSSDMPAAGLISRNPSSNGKREGIG
jgi:uncharacterized protein (DUF58 family)